MKQAEQVDKEWREAHLMNVLQLTRVAYDRACRLDDNLLMLHLYHAMQRAKDMIEAMEGE